MSRRFLHLFSAVAVLSFVGCATHHVEVPADQRATVKRGLEGQDRFLKLSFFSTPFFGDTTRKLLTQVRPDQVRMLERYDGTPITPGGVEAIFPAGTGVRIKSVDFPTAFSSTERVLMTPRAQVWVTVDIAGTPRNAPPYVLVLRPGIKDDRELMAEIDKLLAQEDPKPQISGWSEVVQNAVAAKKVVNDMPAEAVEMAMGYPEKRVLVFEGDQRKETWIWPGNQQVVLLNGRVSQTR